jgi:flagellum-specific peptidoglycan hydrolase FlgJ
MAQAFLESAWGASHVGSANNYFGIKAQKHEDGQITFGSQATGYVYAPTTEYDGKKKLHVIAPFRSYIDISSSFVDHGLFLSENKRYRKALDKYAETGDTNEFARDLQRAHYATDPHYADSLISIMRGRNLYQYNVPRPIAPIGPQPSIGPKP